MCISFSREIGIYWHAGLEISWCHFVSLFGGITEDYRHIYCPHGTESWCKWQKNQALGNNEVIKTSISIQAIIRVEIKSIFERNLARMNF